MPMGSGRAVHRSIGWRWAGIMGVLVVAAGEMLRTFLPYLRHGWWQHNDQYQHVWYWHRAANPGLFPGDRVADYFGQASLTPAGHRWLYQAGLTVVPDPELFAQWLGTGLFAASVLVFYFVAETFLRRVFAAGNRPVAGAAEAYAPALAVGIVAATFAAARCDVFFQTAGGFARSHAPLALLLAVLGLLRRNGPLAGAAAVYAALTYPMIWLVIGAATFAAVAYDAIVARSVAKGLHRWWGWAVGIGLCVVSVALVFAFKPGDVAPEWGPHVGSEEIMTMPEFGPGGRNEIWEPTMLRTLVTGNRAGLQISHNHLPYVLPVMLLAVPMLWRRVPAACWALLATALALWVAALLVIPDLYLPSRYVRYVIRPLFALACGGVAAIGTVWLVGVLRQRWRDGLRPSPRVARLAAFATAAVLAVGYFYLTQSEWRSDLAKVNAPKSIRRPAMRAAWAAIERLPRDTLVAAHPLDADPIPLLARRSVLISDEYALAYHLGFYEQLAKPRLQAALDAVYATQWSDVERLRDDYGVDVLLVDRGRYDPTRRDVIQYHRPFADQIAADFAAGSERGFAVLSPPEDRVLWERKPSDGEAGVMLLWLGPMDAKPAL